MRFSRRLTEQVAQLIGKRLSLGKDIFPHVLGQLLEQRALPRRERGGHLEGDLDQLISPPHARAARNALLFDAEDASRLCSLRDANLAFAVERGHLDLSTERRLHECDRDVASHIVSGAAKERMRAHLDGDLQIAGGLVGARPVAHPAGPLAKLAGPLVTSLCVASVDSLTGQAKKAYTDLLGALGRAPPTSAGERAWILSSLGEIAIRAGDDAEGEGHYKEALESNPSDAYTRAAYADLLLDEGRPAEVIPLLRGRENDDNLLLRLALAEVAAHLSKAASHIDTLSARYLASQARGDVVHRREQARFHLWLRNDAKTALDLAKANWDVQREPWDARIFLESALAAGAPGAARGVAEFLAKSGAEEPRLVALATRVR